MKRLLVFLPLLLLACAPKEAKVPQTAGPLRAQVRTFKAEPGLLTREARASANVVAEKESLVAAGASGRVVRTLPRAPGCGPGRGWSFWTPPPSRRPWPRPGSPCARPRKTWPGPRPRRRGTGRP
ncbi:RND family efflux transporter MFP subunit [Thermus thermophilus]|nr:RND family efflux transporter MFP subunit [Thermus thermophilus]